MKKTIAKVVVLIIALGSMAHIDWKEILREENTLRYGIKQSIEGAREKNMYELENVEELLQDK